MKNSKPKKGSMLDRWRMDEEMYPSNPLGMEKQDGPFTLYYDDGQKRLEGICDNGKPIGKWTYYNENGSIDEEKEYNEDGSVKE